MHKLGIAITAEPQGHPAPPGHPECYRRLSKTIERLTGPEWSDVLQPVPIEEFPREHISKIHDRDYIATVTDLCRKRGGALDADTYLTESSFESSCRLTWAVLSAVHSAFGQGPAKSLVIGRPPGHHAEPARGMGFCLVNHIAVASQYALDECGAGKVAIVDFDVHHGNGTQKAFYDRDDVLFISSHQYPFYPGTGDKSQTGQGRGQGFTVNIPLPAGTEDRDIKIAYDQVWQRLRQFGPDIILVSAGFDAHQSDPLGGLSLTTECYTWFGEELSKRADELCNGRLVAMVEGGYNPTAVSDSVSSFLNGIRREED